MPFWGRRALSSAMHNLHRRQFLTRSLQVMSALSLGGAWLKPACALADHSSFRDDVERASPLTNIAGAFDSSTLTGDNFNKPHDLLRRLDAYLESRGGWPASVSETHDVIIVGGGLSGLLSAHELRDKKWVVFEQAERFGGNSKSEIHGGLRFGLGPAYVSLPEAGSPEEGLFNELGLLKEARVERSSESRVIFGGLKDFWKGETEPGARDCLARIEAAIQICNDRAFPEIPWQPGGDLTREETVELDRFTALQWLEAQGPLHAHVREYFQLYCWSAFGGSIEEISAAQFLNFVASEANGILVFPGGNGRLTEALFHSLKRINPSGLKPGTIVLDVAQSGDRVEALVESADGVLYRIAAKSLIMTAPKYVARHILRKSLSTEQSHAWESINYRAYLVANVLVTFPQPVKAPAFDLFCLKGSAPDAPTFGRRTDRNCTDLVFANWADGEVQGQSVLTLYRPFPLDGARHFLMGFDVEKKKAELTAELKNWLPQIGMKEFSVDGVRLSLWGHSIPLAAAGLMASGVLDRIAQPIGRRIFFANQDDAVNPAFETCFASARRAALAARHLG